jgi:hypothetical protein
MIGFWPIWPISDKDDAELIWYKSCRFIDELERSGDTILNFYALASRVLPERK